MVTVGYFCCFRYGIEFVVGDMSCFFDTFMLFVAVISIDFIVHHCWALPACLSIQLTKIVFLSRCIIECFNPSCRKIIVITFCWCGIICVFRQRFNLHTFTINTRSLYCYLFMVLNFFGHIICHVTLEVLSFGIVFIKWQIPRYDIVYLIKIVWSS